MNRLHICPALSHLLTIVILAGVIAGIPLRGFGITKADADLVYKQGNYQQAITDYRDLLKRGEAAELYYNLGNAYYRSDSLTQAILAYERAALLSPGDPDIRFNLQFARSKTIDKITPQSQMFFVSWYWSLVNFTSVDRWAKVGIAAIIVALLLMLAYLFAPQLTVRKVGFFGSALFLLVFLLSGLFAWQQKQLLEQRGGAIVTAPSVSVKHTPAKGGADDFVLHEGTRVDITDRGVKGWYEVRVADGREGWIPTDRVELI
jgi:tetratricopeptide (TPR) repeat protein